MLPDTIRFSRVIARPTGLQRFAEPLRWDIDHAIRSGLTSYRPREEILVRCWYGLRHDETGLECHGLITLVFIAGENRDERYQARHNPPST